MSRITVRHRFGEAFDVRIRGYKLISDEPAAIGGDDEGPTPTELMVAGLAACAAEEGVTQLRRAGSPFEPFEVDADFTWDMHAERVSSVRLTVTLPPDLPADSVRSVETAMAECPARKMLTQPPTLEYDFTGKAVQTAL